MSNYYSYKDVKVMIAHKLMSIEGWKVYGYKSDESDMMTDYFSPASWGGVAEKNGYILCVNVYGASKPEEIRKYNYNKFAFDENIIEKIQKLKQMTVERGASKQEEESAKESIRRLLKKAEDSKENKNKYIVIGVIPEHMANPSRCNWHIEKDGIIVAKGNGILKYSQAYNYYSNETYIKALEEFKKDKEEYEKNYIQNLIQYGYYNTEEAKKLTACHLIDLEENSKICADFEKFINKIDTTCGNLLGEIGNPTYTKYEKVMITKYKTEIKPVETTKGNIKEGQYFILKDNFGYGYIKGLIYCIHEREYNGKKNYYAYKLNGKLTKECKGMATASNYWSCFDEKFLKWLEKGRIAWCILQEVKTTYEVEKVIKRTIKSSKEKKDKKATDEAIISNLKFEILEDTDTRTNEKIFLVKITDSLDKEMFKEANAYINSLGGYYSKFKHAFLFKEDPSELLKINNANKII